MGKKPKQLKTIASQPIKSKAATVLNTLLNNQRLILPSIFLIAFILRLILLWQIKDAPYFDNPIGDAEIYYQRSLSILAGDWQGQHIPFHSSPIYPFIMAIILGLTDHSFFGLRFFQILIGSINCVLITLLAQALLPRAKQSWAILAGLAAAFYGLLAFFDVDLLMIFFTLTALNASLLLLIKSRTESKLYWSLLAGGCFGLAALDKTNLLLAGPVLIAYLGDFSKVVMKWPWKKIALWLAGLMLMIMPVTINNYLLEKDLVLIASNAGVNLFIGNNPKAEGLFQLAPDSGLSNLDLGGSSVKRAEQELKKKLKPSQVSKYWTNQALDWMSSHPLAVIQLYIKKIKLMWNVEEIPNHLNFKFIRAEYAPVLYLLIISFGLIAPLGLTGILGRLKKWQLNEKLFIGFLIAYMLSLLPFFITARYRLPLVPILIAFTPRACLEFIEAIKTKKWMVVLSLSAILIGLMFFIHQRPPRVMTYTHNRVSVAGTYLERAVKHKATGQADIEKAIVEFKRAIEVEPTSEDGHYNLGRAYESVGFYSAAQAEYETTLSINPTRTKLPPLIELMKQRKRERGDLITRAQLPLTLFEAALLQEQQGNHMGAKKLLKKVIKDDPYHLQAYGKLAFIYMNQRQYKQAINLFRTALHYQPNHFILMNNLAGAYYKAGQYKKAEAIYRQCLRLQPDSQLIIKQLQKLKKRVSRR